MLFLYINELCISHHFPVCLEYQALLVRFWEGYSPIDWHGDGKYKMLWIRVFRYWLLIGVFGYDEPSLSKLPSNLLLDQPSIRRDCDFDSLFLFQKSKTNLYQHLIQTKTQGVGWSWCFVSYQRCRMLATSSSVGRHYLQLAWLQSLGLLPRIRLDCHYILHHPSTSRRKSDNSSSHLEATDCSCLCLDADILVHGHIYVSFLNKPAKDHF